VPRHAPLTVAAATSKAHAMLAVAGTAGINLDALAQVHHRLSAHEHERLGTRPTPRRTELDRMIATDLDVLAAAFKLLERAVGRTPSR